MMKKFYVTILCAFCSLGLNAQNFNLGVTASVSISQSYYNTSNPAISFPGEVAGVFAEYQPSLELPVFFRAELDWSHCPDHYIHSYSDDGARQANIDEKRESDYLSLPLMLEYVSAHGKLKFCIGQELSYAMKFKASISGVIYDSSGHETAISKEYTNTSKDYDPWGAALFAGAEYLVSDHIGVNCRYYQNIRKSSINNSYGTRRLQMGLCWYF